MDDNPTSPESPNRSEPSVPLTRDVIEREPNGLRRIGRRGLALVEDMAAGGQSMTSIAKALRIHRHTLREVLKRQPEVQEAIERGRGILEDELTDLLLEQARGGHVVAAIFLAKARCGWREGETREPVSVTVQVEQPPALTDAQFAALLAAPVVDVAAEDPAK